MVCPCCVPQECECRNGCHYTFTCQAEETSWPATATAVLEPSDCDFCGDDEPVIDVVENPLRTDDQTGSGTDNTLQAIVNTPSLASSQSSERYAVPDENNPFINVYEEIKNTSYSALFSCEVIDDKATWSVFVSFSYTHSVLTGNPTEKFQSTIRTCFKEVVFSSNCPNPCSVTVVLTPDGFTVNGVEHEWDCGTDTEECTEYDENGDPTECFDYLNSPMPITTITRECREECEFP